MSSSHVSFLLYHNLYLIYGCSPSFLRLFVPFSLLSSLLDMLRLGFHSGMNSLSSTCMRLTGALLPVAWWPPLLTVEIIDNVLALEIVMGARTWFPPLLTVENKDMCSVLAQELVMGARLGAQARLSLENVLPAKTRQTTQRQRTKILQPSDCHLNDHSQSELFVRRKKPALTTHPRRTGSH